MLLVRLQPGLPGGPWARLRALSGHDEQALAEAGAGVAARAAVELLDRILVEAPGTCVGPGRAKELALCDRDRLLAAIYADCFGDRIESKVPCEQCGEGSELSFSLAALVASLERERETAREQGIEGPDAEGRYTLADGTRFRLPSSADHIASFGLGSEQVRAALLRRCVLADPSSGGRRTASDMTAEALERVEAAMELVGPVIDRDLQVRCHECGAARELRFDIQHFLLRALAHERRYLVREVHYLARSYGWSLAEILALSRSDRRAYVGLIAAERSAQRRSARA